MALTKKDLSAIEDIVDRKVSGIVDRKVNGSEGRLKKFVKSHLDEKLAESEQHIFAVMKHENSLIKEKIDQEVGDIADMLRPVIHDVERLKVKVGLTTEET